jgi:hypothetical protein
MSFVARAIPKGWGADTIAVFTTASLARLLGSPLPGNANTPSAPVSFLCRYGSDVAIPERDVILARVPMVLVEHVPRPGWQTGGFAGGTAAGQRDVAAAKRLGYPVGAHLCFDLEGLGDQGTSVEDYVSGRCHVVRGEGFLPASYEGYDDGLTMALRLALSGPDGIDVWWSDYGPRTPPPGIGFVWTQHPQQMFNGVEIDPDECHGVDLRGRPMIGMWLEQDVNVEPSDPSIAIPVPSDAMTDEGSKP